MIISKTKKTNSLAFLLGAMMPLAFAPYNIWLISIVSITGLLYLWQQANKSIQLFKLGFFFGLGYFGFGIHWVYFSLHDFGNAIPLVAAGITVLLICWQSFYIALLGLVYSQIKIKFGTSVVITIVPLLWFSMEWLKGIVITGFPWLSIGYSHLESPLSVFAPWIGSYGLSALSVCISAIIFIVATKQSRQYKKFLMITVSAILFLGFLADTKQTEGMEQSIRITQIQGNIAQETKWKAEKRQEIFETYWHETLKHWDSDLIVWPETAVPGRSELIEESLILPMSMIATENETNILFGIIGSDLARNHVFNSMIMVGENHGVYNKRHLVPFGEYMPLRWLLDIFNRIIQIPMSDMQAGKNEQPLMSINEIQLGVSICYEDVFSRDINKDLPQANILINTSNDAWFGDSLAPHQHLQIAQMRSLETGRPMVRSTNTGITAFIDYKGRITQKTSQFKEEAITQSVTGRTGTTFFVLFQPYQWLIVLLIGLFSMYTVFTLKGHKKK